MVHFIQNENILLAQIHLSAHCDRDMLFRWAAAQAACTGAQHYSAPCTKFALLVKLHKVSVDPIFKFLKVLSTEAPLFGLRTNHF